MVTLLSSIHQAVETKVKTNFIGQPVIKPYVVHDYNIRMGGVDLSDNFLSLYQTLKSIKWYRKLLLHLINMATLNAHILNKKYGVQKMSHCAYREYIAKYLITTSVESATCLKKKTVNWNRQFSFTVGREAFCKKILNGSWFKKENTS